MTEVPIERRFCGSVRLVTLHLWRVAHSTDIDEGFRAARSLGMISEDNETFIRSCMAIGERIEKGDAPDIPLTKELVDELQLCAIRLNSADPA